MVTELFAAALDDHTGAALALRALAIADVVDDRGACAPEAYGALLWAAATAAERAATGPSSATAAAACDRTVAFVRDALRRRSTAE